jgi:hypothetical protein
VSAREREQDPAYRLQRLQRQLAQREAQAKAQADGARPKLAQPAGGGGVVGAGAWGGGGAAVVRDRANHKKKGAKPPAWAVMPPI